MKMKNNPDLWAELIEGLKHSWPQVSGTAAAILICWGRLIYDGVECKNKWAECLLCGVLSWAISSGIEAFGISSGVSPMIGGAVGFIGVDKIREMAIRAINKRIGDDK
nr:phage holin, lambda family [Photorhabdus hindustanensis]